MAKAIVQINSAVPCPAWTEIAAKAGIKTIWFSPDLNPASINPDLVLLQYAIQSQDLRELGYDRVSCPIVASCGDAAPITNLEQTFTNLDLLTRLDVEGYDYIDYYRRWRGHRADQSHKFRLLKQCADHNFEVVESPQHYDWMFVGQIYPAYDCRLKHYRNSLISELWRSVPNGYVSGAPEWTTILGDGIERARIPQLALSALYAQSHVIVSIDAHDGAGYTSTRTIEAMYAGRCVFLYRHAGISALPEFVDGVNIFLFSSVDEFREKLAYVIGDPAVERSVGQAARELIIEKDWTYSGWVRRALALLK